MKLKSQAQLEKLKELEKLGKVPAGTVDKAKKEHAKTGKPLPLRTTWKKWK